MIIVFPSHELIHKFIGSFDDFIDLFYLFFLDLFVTTVYSLLILAVLLYGPSESIRKRICIRLFDWGVIERECERLNGVHIWEYIDVFT